MAQSVTLSSVGVTAGIGLNPVSKTTIAQITFTATGTSDLTLQATLDDFQTSSSPVWGNVSTTHFSSLNFADGVFITLLSPVAGLRLSSSTWSGGTAPTAVLKVLQAVTA